MVIYKRKICGVSITGNFKYEICFNSFLTSKNIWNRLSTEFIFALNYHDNSREAKMIHLNGAGRNIVPIVIYVCIVIVLHVYILYPHSVCQDI